MYTLVWLLALTQYLDYDLTARTPSFTTTYTLLRTMTVRHVHAKSNVYITASLILVKYLEWKGCVSSSNSNTGTSDTTGKNNDGTV